MIFFLSLLKSYIFAFQKLGIRHLTNNLFYKKDDKAEIVNEISKKTGIDKATVLTAVEAFMESVKESLIQKRITYIFAASVVSFLKKELKRRLVIFPRIRL